VRQWSPWEKSVIIILLLILMSEIGAAVFHKRGQDAVEAQLIETQRSAWQAAQSEHESAVHVQQMLSQFSARLDQYQQGRNLQVQRNMAQTKTDLAMQAEIEELARRKR
jgi:hypothetical protein